MANVGDKFVIEIDKVFTESNNGNKLYRIKGFNSLVFDENGIIRLEKFEPKIRIIPVCGNVWKDVKTGEEEIVIINNDDDIIFGINLQTRRGLVMPFSHFVTKYEPTIGVDYSHELGVIFGDLPF